MPRRERADARAGACARADESGVHYLHADIRDAAFPPQRYDLIVTHFFLDCFGETDACGSGGKIERGSATEDAIWLIADFHEPPRGWRRWLGRFLIATMYLFFPHRSPGSKRGRLVDYAPLLKAPAFA